MLIQLKDHQTPEVLGHLILYTQRGAEATKAWNIPQSDGALSLGLEYTPTDIPKGSEQPQLDFHRLQWLHHGLSVSPLVPCKQASRSAAKW